MNHPISRRILISAMFALFGADALARRRDRDRGIGGTGFPMLVDPDEGDRGIGGTGVIGTIRRFGSIFVNDMRIAYPADASVEIDGRATTSADLRIGQVVHTVATTDGAGFVTERILVTSEVVGPIERLAHGRLVVLGQSVALDFVDAGGLRKGQWIAVSGLRELDGVIAASYVQRRDDSLAQVAGPVRVKNGVAWIGGLALVNLDPALAGRRVLATVGRLDGRPAAISVTPDPELASMPNARRLSIETYVKRKGGELRMGNGLAVVASSQTPASAPTRAFVAVTVNGDGGLTAAGQAPAAKPQTTTRLDRAPTPRDGASDKPGERDGKGAKRKDEGKKDGKKEEGKASSKQGETSAKSDEKARSALDDLWANHNRGGGGGSGRAPKAAPPTPETHHEQSNDWLTNNGKHPR
jgi:hypothetical protein